MEIMSIILTQTHCNIRNLLPIPPDVWEKVCIELGGKDKSDVDGVNAAAMNVGRCVTSTDF
jgi:hypothetical protein